jgi:hypothetical protein
MPLKLASEPFTRLPIAHLLGPFPAHSLAMHHCTFPAPAVVRYCTCHCAVSAYSGRCGDSAPACLLYIISSSLLSQTLSNPSAQDTLSSS